LGATLVGTPVGIVQGIAHLVGGLPVRLLIAALAGGSPRRCEQRRPARPLGQDLLMAIFLASSCFGSGMRISRTPAL
jgi:hypothetical protein